MCAYVYVRIAHLIKEKNNATKKILMVLDENWLFITISHDYEGGLGSGSQFLLQSCSCNYNQTVTGAG